MNGCATGQAKITPGFELPARYIIHTVGPVWSGGQRNEAGLLRSCYQQSLYLAMEHQLTSMAFPSISCGSYRFPIEQAADIAIRTIREVLSQADMPMQVYLINFDDTTHRQYLRVFEQLNDENS